MDFFAHEQGDMCHVMNNGFHKCVGVEVLWGRALDEGMVPW